MFSHLHAPEKLHEQLALLETSAQLVGLHQGFSSWAEFFVLGNQGNLATAQLAAKLTRVCTPHPIYCAGNSVRIYTVAPNGETGAA